MWNITDVVPSVVKHQKNVETEQVCRLIMTIDAVRRQLGTPRNHVESVCEDYSACIATKD